MFVITGTVLCASPFPMLLKSSHYSQLHEYSVWHVHVDNLHGGAGKSLARPTSRCRRTELIVSLDRGVCCKSFLVTEAERKHVRQRASCHQVFFFLQGKALQEIQAIVIETLGGTCTIVCHRQKLDGTV